MIRDQQLEVIRQKCIEANPDSFECEIFGCQGSKYCNEKRPIRLSDVLLAIGHNDGVTLGLDRKRSGAVLSIIKRLNDDGYYDAAYWNLRKDDLTNQSDECITFLAALLK